jgi:UDP-N-acetyl-D-mannosaminuronate dehydrogenase
MKEFVDVKISVIGCGWLGLPLAINLIDKGFKVNGSSTSNEKLAALKANAIAPFLVQLGKPNNNSLSDFLKADLLIVNVPPGRNNEDVNDYSNKMVELAKAISESTIKKIIFISSTSVYDEINELVDETSMSLSNSNS